MPELSSRCRSLCTTFQDNDYAHRLGIFPGHRDHPRVLLHTARSGLRARRPVSGLSPGQRRRRGAHAHWRSAVSQRAHQPAARIGIAGIVLGLLILQIPAEFSRQALAAHFRPAAGIGFAVVTGVTIATYSLWDKVGVSHVPPLLYVTGAFLGPALTMSWLLRRRVNSLVAAWRAHPVSMGAGAVLSPLAYSLALVALSIAQVSQVAPLREVGVVIGTVLGILVLREQSPIPRIGGATVIALGAIVLAYSSVTI